MDFHYPSNEVGAQQSTTFQPFTVPPPLLSNGFAFFQPGDFSPVPGPPMTPFDMITTSPSQLPWLSLPDAAKEHGHYEMPPNTSALSLPLPGEDSPPSSPSTSIDQLPEDETKDELRVRLDHEIRSAPWFKNNKPEPTVGAPGVPAWAARLASRGRSIYECFVTAVRVKDAIVYKCSSPGCKGCKFKSTRLRRVVGHQRKMRKHKPFVCEAHPGCAFRGHTKDNITDHCSARNATVNCDKCCALVVKKNLGRHMKDVHRRR